MFPFHNNRTIVECHSECRPWWLHNSSSCSWTINIHLKSFHGDGVCADINTVVWPLTLFTTEELALKNLWNTFNITKQGPVECDQLLRAKLNCTVTALCHKLGPRKAHCEGQGHRSPEFGKFKSRVKGLWAANVAWIKEVHPFIAYHQTKVLGCPKSSRKQKNTTRFIANFSPRTSNVFPKNHTNFQSSVFWMVLNQAAPHLLTLYKKSSFCWQFWFL